MDKKVKRKAKRIVSVGLFPPSKLEGNTIYVSLRYAVQESSEDSTEKREIYAEAVSANKFRYNIFGFESAGPGCSVIVNKKHLVTKISNRSLVSIPSLNPYKEFIQRIVKDNGAVRDDTRIYSDGLAAKEKLEGIEKLISAK
jgi:hypothetical protein